MIFDYLAIIGQPILYHNMVLYALRGLDSNWNSFISCITLRPILILFDEFYSHRPANERIFDQ